MGAGEKHLRSVEFGLLAERYQCSLLYKCVLGWKIIAKIDKISTIIAFIVVQVYVFKFLKF